MGKDSPHDDSTPQSPPRADWDDTEKVGVVIACSTHGVVQEYDTLLDGTITCGYCAIDEEVNSSLRVP